MEIPQIDKPQQVEVRRTIRGGQSPERNEPCPCESGLKYKHCHGDPIKIQTVQRAVMVVMARLIQEEQMKRGIIPYPWTCNSCGKGFMQPANSTIAPGTPICPHCDSTDIVQTEMEKENGEV